MKNYSITSIMLHYKIQYLYLAVVVGTLLVTSCKKEYTDFPYKNIETFAVKDANGNTLQAAIKNQEIIFYWPPYQEIPEFIKPTITISERSTIFPASGTEVRFDQSTTYTVTAQDGTTQVFTLKPSVNQPVPYFNLPSPEMQIGTEFAILGDYFIPDKAKTKVFLVNSAKQEFELTDPTKLTNAQIIFTIPFTFSADTGKYDIKIISGQRTVSNGPYRLLRPGLTVSQENLPTTVKKGADLNFNILPVIEKYYKNDNMFAELTINGEQVRCVVKKPENNLLKIAIPATIPTGIIAVVRIYDEKNTVLGAFRSNISVTD